jgi:hypothetical protein
MTLQLDHQQRLNLHSILGAQRASVDGVRKLWKIQDRISLTAEEERAIELKREITEGREQVRWNPERTLPAQPFEFSDAETLIVRDAIKALDFGAAIDRSWLEPIVRAVFAEEKTGETK